MEATASSGNTRSHKKHIFNVQAYLTSGGVARNVIEYRRSEKAYSQGDPTKSVMYIQEGGVKLTVVNATGKEAVVAILGPGDFLGEGCLAGKTECIATATTIAPTTVLTIEKER